MSEPTTDYLEDFERKINLEPADKGLRFANFLIDYIVFNIVSYLVTSAYEALVIPQYTYIDEDAALVFSLYGVFISIGVFVLFYTSFEYYTKGRSLGKLATNTIAVRLDGSPITFKDALLRSLCRLIPFETFSALFVTPWHDSITGTTVVKKTWS